MRNILVIMGDKVVDGEYKLSDSQNLKFNNHVYDDFKVKQISSVEEYHSTLKALAS